MTDKASPYQAGGGQPRDTDLTRFWRDWADLWRSEMRAQATEPDGINAALLGALAKGGLTAEIAASMEAWRAAMVFWADVMGPGTGTGAGGAPADAAAVVRSRDRAVPPGTAAANAASDPRDAEIERLIRRVDELETRLSELERPRRRGKGRA